jgi:alginate O-acetyltransferase complex protein AlgI
MQFNSTAFAIFLPIVFLAYWFIANKNLSLQNGLLLASSYIFYAWWDYRFLFLLAFSTLLDYAVGFKIFQARGRAKKQWLWLSVIVNLGFLCVFKYYNFFADSLADLLLQIGVKANLSSLTIILPVGISFYTFHGLSYVFDIYRGKIKPEPNWMNYAVFVSFFPLLVAGPIERATHLLPQIVSKRTFDYSKAVDGLRQILWGLCKKIIIADTCAKYVNLAFENTHTSPGSTLVMGAVFFSIQIYCDFSGYSDIAIGTARLFGIDLLRNFSFPYFSRNIAEFWRRWHISLTTWFRDYLYIPLGGSRGNTWQNIRNVFIVFLVSGFWHGANWTFIVWGAIHAMLFLPLLLLKRNRAHLDIVAHGKQFPSLKELSSMVITFSMVTLAWIFFRAENLGHAIDYISGIFSGSLFTVPEQMPKLFLLILVLFFATEWLGREQQYALARVGLNWPKPVRWAFYYSLITGLVYFLGTDRTFIYFQF